jgi:hypothetical protein
MKLPDRKKQLLNSLCFPRVALSVIDYHYGAETTTGATTVQKDG